MMAESSSLVLSMEAVVGGQIIIPKCHPRLIDRLQQKLRFDNPEYRKAKRFGRDASGIPEEIYAIKEMPDGSCIVPRGCIKELKQIVGVDGTVLKFTDRRSLGRPIGPFEETKLFKEKPPRPYQKQLIEMIKTFFQGLGVLPCGSGKTRCGVDAIRAVGRTTLVLVHTDDLADQWAETIKDYLGIRCGVVNAKKKETDRDVVVGSVWSMLPILKDDPEYGKRFGLVILDEAHHAPAATFDDVLSRLPAKYRLGLTATPDREDGQTKKMDWSFGPRLITKTVDEMIAAKYLTKPEVKLVETTFYHEVKNRNFHELDRALILDPERNDLIVKIASENVSDNQIVLVLSQRKEHCVRLGQMLNERKCPAYVLLGTTQKQLRKTIIQGMRDGKVRCIIATQLADEGLDIARLSRIILAFPQRAKGPTIQRVGRVMRNFAGKVPVLYDLVDSQVPTLKSRAKDRQTAYRSIGIL